MEVKVRNGEGENATSGLIPQKETGQEFGKTELVLLNLIAEIIIEIVMRNDDE